jgi:2-oxo-4-hydroxy-4-carboxy-5-ureidoimidazoline decarboxylase
MALADWNSAPRPSAESDLLCCCASPVWAGEVAAGRPYRSLDALLSAAADRLARLPWNQIQLALRAHPRIGQPRAGAGRDAQWSRREQSGAASADPETAAALAEANRRYEERFGHLFLIFASGRTGAELLAEARRRLGHDRATERRVVRSELDRIVRSRLTTLLDPPVPARRRAPAVNQP